MKTEAWTKKMQTKNNSFYILGSGSKLLPNEKYKLAPLLYASSKFHNTTVQHLMEAIFSPAARQSWDSSFVSNDVIKNISDPSILIQK